MVRKVEHLVKVEEL